MQFIGVVPLNLSEAESNPIFKTRFITAVTTSKFRTTIDLLFSQLITFWGSQQRQNHHTHPVCHSQINPDTQDHQSQSIENSLYLQYGTKVRVHYDATVLDKQIQNVTEIIQEYPLCKPESWNRSAPFKSSACLVFSAHSLKFY